ncbi:sigma-70 family RNA polymerase sigma factor [Saccharopolyspora hordei]|uniref:RNA polymerase sigma-70 factor (ECF subfamily) n=1 Tax=Saccharopolyspora hordei TaxID=1838 RepID=A0A853AUC6_9PSEU|nr:sigma-70 family RNA polymerase sigma factor [Saccharopolyspora hordei]NYI86257.1 RNA polymerase sigma-70 factor (ECF subfamily) [Saccharopolyspora hordei]
MPSVQLEDVVRAHGDALHAYVTRLTGGDRFAAEDVVQETWVRAWRNLDRLTEDLGSVRGWLLRVAHNLAVDLHRSRRARPTEVGLPEQGLESAAIAPNAHDQVENRIVVRALLEALSPAHRATVLEVYYADRTAASAAQALGVPPGTVKSRLHNAIRTLREALPAQPLAA